MFRLEVIKFFLNREDDYVQLIVLEVFELAEENRDVFMDVEFFIFFGFVKWKQEIWDVFESKFFCLFFFVDSCCMFFILLDCGL